MPDENPWCITCDDWVNNGEIDGNPGHFTIPNKNTDGNRTLCRYADVSLPDEKYIGHVEIMTATCYGPGIPYSVASSLCDCGRRIIFDPYFVILEDNYKLEDNLETKSLPQRSLDNKFYSERTGLNFSYEAFFPPNFDENKEYAVLVDIYAGPGSQAIRSRFSLDFSDHLMTSKNNVILVRLDARGSGNDNDELKHSVYRKIGQIERVDVTDFVDWFSEQEFVDKSKLAIWGWSFGGYATSHVAAYNEGSQLFNCAVAVAPLTSRTYYDTLWSEITMGLPDDNTEGYTKGEVWGGDDSDMRNFDDIKFSVIHGTADDNVHFQNAARLSKEIIKSGADFNSYFYADEAHSINYAKNSKEHVYRLIERKLVDCLEHNVL